MASNLEEQLQQEEGLDFSDELQSAERQFLKESQQHGIASEATTFTYACYLLKSSDPRHVKIAQSLLKELVYQSQSNREYLYYCALACHKTGDYSQARHFVERLLQIEPTNRQAVDLHKLIQKKVTQDGLIGIALAGTAAAAVGLLTVGVVKALRK